MDNTSVADAYRISPVAYDVMFVPPLAIANVPPKVNVPDAVIGPPVKVKPVVPPEPSTEVTVPTPATDCQVGAEPPLEVNT